jgi:hypothetical protein
MPMATTNPTLTLYELVNPSDPYTFYAPSVEVAGVAAYSLSTGFGATPVAGGESSPVLFGWVEWFEAKGIDNAWCEAHLAEIADALDSFLIGSAAHRADVESMLDELPAEKREAWRAKRQDRHRSSMNQIGEAAYARAKQLRQKAAAQQEKVANGQN